MNDRMQADESVLPWLRLNLVPGIGPVLMARLLDEFDHDPAAIFATSEQRLRRVKGIGKGAAAALMDRSHQDRAEEEWQLASDHDVAIIGPDHEAWPPGLRAVHDPPAVLYVRGELRPDDAVAIGIVGTRAPNYYGRDQARRFGDLLARAGFTVVSGFAAGVDTAAHRGALQAKGRTVAVLGSGMLDLYPAENADLVEEVAASGAVITEFSMRTAPSTGTFPRRNRIIAGMSLGTLVVQADRRSGAMITARLASEYGREVFAIPGPIDQDRHRGCHDLIRDGATLVHTVADILDQLGPVSAELTASQAAARSRQRDLFGAAGDGDDGANATADTAEERTAPSADPAVPANLTPDEAAVHAAIGADPVGVDALAASLGLPVHRVIGALTMLEIKGAIRQLAGRHYVRPARQ